VRRVSAGLGSVAALVRLRVQHELQYRGNLFVHVFQSLVDLAVGLFTVWLVYRNVDELNGWTESELLVVVGMYLMLDGIISGQLNPNVLAFTRDIREGTFDFALLAPIDEQLMIGTREFNLWGMINLPVGAIVVAVAGSRVPGVGLLDVVYFLSMIPVAVALLYSFFLAVATSAFWLVNIDEILFRVFQSATYAGRWPLGIYPRWLQGTLTAIVPIGLAVTVPSAALTDRLDRWSALAAVGVAVLALVGSRRLFRRGIRSYSGASA